MPFIRLPQEIIDNIIRLKSLIIRNQCDDAMIKAIVRFTIEEIRAAIVPVLKHPPTKEEAKCIRDIAELVLKNILEIKTPPTGNSRQSNMSPQDDVIEAMAAIKDESLEKLRELRAGQPKIEDNKS